MIKKVILMEANDNVATALDDIIKNDSVVLLSHNNEILGNLNALNNIPFGNKIALKNIPVGCEIIKYNSTIGESTKNIVQGELVHVHNVKSLRVDIPEAFKKEIVRQMNIDVEV